jgi:hypothetical protein
MVRVRPRKLNKNTILTTVVFGYKDIVYMDKTTEIWLFSKTVVVYMDKTNEIFIWTKRNVFTWTKRQKFVLIAKYDSTKFFLFPIFTGNFRFFFLTKNLHFLQISGKNRKSNTVHAHSLEHHKFDGCAQSGTFLQNFFLLQESVSNSRFDQLKKSLPSVPDRAQIKVCGVPVGAHGLYQKHCMCLFRLTYSMCFFTCEMKIVI